MLKKLVVANVKAFHEEETLNKPVTAEVSNANGTDNTSPIKAMNFYLNNNITTPVNTPRSAEITERATGENMISTSSVFSASELKLSAANNDDAEVANAEETEKFIGSLTVRNSLVQGIGEVMLVLIQPDGKVLRSAWESGSFDTDGGKKIYSRKIKFDYNKGEARRINFSVPADNIQKGTYTLQVYSNGKVIGRVAKVVG